MSRVVVDMLDQRPIWQPPEWALDHIRDAFGGWDVVVMREPADGTGDGRPDPSPALLDAVREAEVYLGYGVPAEVLRAGPRLRWVHTGTAGVRGSLTPEMRGRGVVFTNSAGVHAPPMAESVLAMMLYFARGLDLAVAAQVDGEWRKGPFNGEDAPLHELGDATVGILGYGGVGREVARRARALGARVVALKRRPVPPPRDVRLVYGRDGLYELLDAADYVVVALPETAATQGLLDRDALARLRPGAVLINVGRGALIDEPALIEQLRAGRLRGAGLDVFAREPLPADSPLWRLPGVLITPHISATTRGFWRRETALIQENADRLRAGRPLLNVVDKDAGY